jgi:large subunit ribosomal protein L17
MRHSKIGRKFGRTKDVRTALKTSLVEALVSREKILTTEARAKEIRPIVEAMVTKAKKGTLAVRRDLISSLGGRASVAKKLVEVLAPRYKDRKGGYLRITKVVKRASDGRQSAVIEFVV